MRPQLCQTGQETAGRNNMHAAVEPVDGLARVRSEAVPVIKEMAELQEMPGDQILEARSLVGNHSPAL